MIPVPSGMRVWLAVGRCGSRPTGLASANARQINPR